MSYNVVLTRSFRHSVKRLQKRFRHVKEDVQVAIRVLLQTPRLGKDAAARQVFEALNGISYRVKPDDQIRRGEVHDIFQRAVPQSLLAG